MRQNAKSLNISSNSVDALAKYRPRHQETGEFTATEAAVSWGVSFCTAQRMLKERVDAGDFLRIDNVLLKNGKKGSVWREKK